MKPNVSPGKAGVGIVEVEGQEGRFICLDLGTAQIFLGPEDAIKLGRKIVDMGYAAGHIEKCKWCGSEKSVVRDECGRCRSQMKRAQTNAHNNFHSLPARHVTMHQEYSKQLGYSACEGGAPSFDSDEDE